MKTMKSTRYLIVLAALAAVAGLMWLYKGKDWLIRDAIVSAAEKATGVNVHLGSVRVELTKGDGLLKDFRLGNPKGFSREELLAIGKGTIDLDLKSVTGPVVQVTKVPAWRRSWSTRVVFPWSTWAMMAIFLSFGFAIKIPK